LQKEKLESQNRRGPPLEAAQSQCWAELRRDSGAGELLLQIRRGHVRDNDTKNPSKPFSNQCYGESVILAEAAAKFDGAGLTEHGAFPMMKVSVTAAQAITTEGTEITEEISRRFPL